MSLQLNYIIGIDEVGRGPLAGPVVVSALAIPRNYKLQIADSKLFLRDSKKLSAKQREAWFGIIKNNPRIFYAVARIYPQKIDAINITSAANLAATKALKKLITNYKLPIASCKTFLDGGLYLQKYLYSEFRILYSRTIIKGDEKIPVISLASIVAKVTRDKYMVKLHKKYPQYGFNQHKGYGTKAHIEAIKKYGLSDVHRLTFTKKYTNMIKKEHRTYNIEYRTLA